MLLHNSLKSKHNRLSNNETMYKIKKNTTEYTLSKHFFKTTLLQILLLLLQYNLEINVKPKRSRGKIGLDPIGQASIDSSQGDVECLVFPVRDRTSAIPRKCHLDHYFTGNCNTKYTSSAVFRSSLDLYKTIVL